jgi:hypothetical protein
MKIYIDLGLDFKIYKSSKLNMQMANKESL